MTKYKIAVIPGDGVGPEIINEGKKIIECVSEIEDYSIEWVEYPFGSENYLKTGKLIDEDDLKEVSKSESIYLGALGDPRVEPGVLEKKILLALRFHFDQYINLRPIRLLDGIQSVLKNKEHKDINMTFIRENTEDFYVAIGDRVNKKQSKKLLELKRNLYNIKFGLDIETDTDEIAYQIGVISKQGAKRVIEYAFNRAKKSDRKKVTSVDKANVLTNVYGLWRDVFEEVSTEYPDIHHEYALVDAVAMWMVKNPESFDVVVTPNLFGDILTDLGAIIQGGMGLAPGGNISIENLSMYEPIHGSAPKYKNKGIVNPIATIWAGAMMMQELGEEESYNKIMKSIQHVIKDGKIRTKDIGGSATTSEVGDEIVKHIKM